MTNYHIIGGDGRQYGPITADAVREWIAEGRLHDQSQAQVAGAADWRALNTFPEFAEALRSHAQLPPIAAPASPTDWSARILAREPELRLGECLSAGFSFLAAHPGFVLGAVCLSCFLNSIMLVLPAVGSILHLMLSGVLTGGLYLACLRQMRGELVGIGNIFDGFKHHFVQLMLAGAISSLLTQLGLLLCLLPGIYLLVAWSFVLPLVADKRLEFWSAMELSRKMVTRVWFPVLLLLVLVFLPFVLALCIASFQMGDFLFGSLREADFDVLVWSQSLLQQAHQLFKLGLITALIGQAGLLLSQFIAVGALMRAYENLFTERRP